MIYENTLSIIKPDATKRNLIGQIISYLEKENLKIIAQKMILLNSEQAITFYYEHKLKKFFSDLINNITSHTIILQILKGKNAIQKTRDIIGHTDPNQATIGTIRKTFGKSIIENSIHSSDSQINAEREIKLFFEKEEIFF